MADGLSPLGGPGEDGKVGEEELGGLEMGLDTGDRGGVGGGVGGPSMSHSKVVMFMLGLHMRAGFVLSMVTDGEVETSEPQLAKRLVNDRGRDLVFILPGSLGK